MSSKKRKGGRTTPAPSPQEKLRRQRLTEAKRAHKTATRAAMATPDDHELRAKAFALGATVKLIEGLGD